MIKMKKSDAAIAYAVIVLMLGGLLTGLAACQMGMMDSLDLGGTPTTSLDSPTISGWYGGGAKTPTLNISGGGQILNGETLEWLPTDGSLDLTALIADAPAGAQVRWTITGPADVVVFDGSSETEKTVSADDPVTIQPGAKFREDTVTVTAALEGYSGVTASFTIEPGPHIVLYWDADRVDGGDEIRNGDTINVEKKRETKTAKAELCNAPADFEYLQWTIGTDTDPNSNVSEGNFIEFNSGWSSDMAVMLSSEVTIKIRPSEDKAIITVWNCDSTGTNRGEVSSSFTLDVK